MIALLSGPECPIISPFLISDFSIDIASTTCSLLAPKLGMVSLTVF